MINNKISVNENFVVLSDNEIDFDEKGSKLFETQKIDGIFAVDEISLVFTHKNGLKNGYKIPENFSIIGFADGV